jgi:hypothetical protein
LSHGDSYRFFQVSSFIKNDDGVQNLPHAFVLIEFANLRLLASSFSQFRKDPTRSFNKSEKNLSA